MTKVPAHWDVLRLKTCASNIVEQAPLGGSGRRGLALESVESWTGRIRDTAALEGAVKRFRRGDVLFGKLRPYLAKVVRPEEDGVCVGEFLVLRPRGEWFDSTFMAHLLRSKPIIEAVSASTFGARMPRAEWDFIGAMRVPVPPRGEQEAIVRFLDHADRRIQRAIRAKQRLIALLNEQKQAVIHCAVTRGLDPNVRLKQSGVERLGDVPEHWHVNRLSHFAVLQRGYDITKDEQHAGAVPVVSSGGISSYHDTATGIGPGVLVGRKGTAGSLHYLESDYWAHDTTLFVRDFKGNSPRFVYYVLLALELNRLDTGSANPTLNRNLIHPERVAVPPLREQLAIVNQTDWILTRLTAAVELAASAIVVLHEYSQRLISDVVTGRLDVREAAASLPSNVDELDVREGEPIDEDVQDPEPVEA